MHMILILSCIMVFAVVPGYWLYRKGRLIELEARAREWNPPLSEDEPDNPFALNRRLIGFSLPETRPTMQEAGENIVRAFTPGIDFKHAVPIMQIGSPSPVAYYDHETGLIQSVDSADVKQEPLHDLPTECEMINSML